MDAFWTASLADQPCAGHKKAGACCAAHIPMSPAMCLFMDPGESFGVKSGEAVMA